MYFDTHAHYDSEAFDPDRDALLRSMPGRGVTRILNPGADLPSSRSAVRLAETYPFVRAAVGIHPEAADTCTAEALEELRALASGSNRVAAVGEIGLDYHFPDAPAREIQRRCFETQLELARELKLPVIVHERDAWADCLELLKAHPGLSGVVHCFSGSWETAKTLLDMGWFLSFTGVITFRNARRAPEVLARMPRDRLMLETDAPYMAPVPVRGTRNDSGNLRYIAARAAELTGMEPEALAAQTMENALRFFGPERGEEPGA